jgi:ubiquinone/menaquinone biosynthesis C-methylase UbiE
MPTNPRENKTTYIVNPEEPNETLRLMALDEAITGGMGSLLPDALGLTQVGTLLDIACGPAAWALQVAQDYPEIEVVGVDISRSMIRYANGRADALDLQKASFQEMDVLQPLAFPDESFDVVNARLIQAFMPKDAWPQFLLECVRITRPGGYIRLTEAEWAWTNKPACEQINSRATHGMWLTGKGYYPEGKLVGITLMLSKFLRDAGLQDIQRQAHAIDFSYGEAAYESMCQMLTFGLLFLQPFLQQTEGLSQKDFDRWYQQALVEMQEEDFRGLYFFLSSWGRKPNRTM